MNLLDRLCKGAREWQTIRPRQVAGRNWRPVSTAPLQRCSIRRPDPAKEKAWLVANPGLELTDCITYVRNVIEWAYRQIGDNSTAERLPKGLKLYEFMVKEKGWKGIYWNCDVARPREADPKYAIDEVDAYISVKKTGHYRPAGRYQIDVPIHALVVQFKPTSPSLRPRHYSTRLTAPDKGNLPLPTLDPALLAAFKRVTFAAILGKAGDHNALLLSGSVYEVNYCVGPGNPGLYYNGPLEKWAETWGSGIAVAPPGEWARARTP